MLMLGDLRRLGDLQTSFRPAGLENPDPTCKRERRNPGIFEFFQAQLGLSAHLGPCQNATRSLPKIVCKIILMAQIFNFFLYYLRNNAWKIVKHPKNSA